MAKIDLDAMSIEEVADLRDIATDKLAEKVAARRAELEAELEKLAQYDKPARKSQVAAPAAKARKSAARTARPARPQKDRRGQGAGRQGRLTTQAYAAMIRHRRSNPTGRAIISAARLSDLIP